MWEKWKGKMECEGGGEREWREWGMEEWNGRPNLYLYRI